METIPLKRRPQEESIRLDPEGNWYHGEYPILHERTVQFLHRNINVDKNGRYYLSGEDKPVYFVVDDVPFFITKVEKTIAGFLIHLTDETIELLDMENLWSGPKQDSLYCIVKGGQAAAKFFRHPYYDITRGMIQEKGNFYIPFGSKRFVIEKKAPKAVLAMEAAQPKPEVRKPKKSLAHAPTPAPVAAAPKKKPAAKPAKPTKKPAAKKAAKKKPAPKKKAAAKKKPKKKGR